MLKRFASRDSSSWYSSSSFNQSKRQVTVTAESRAPDDKDRNQLVVVKEQGEKAAALAHELSSPAEQRTVNTVNEKMAAVFGGSVAIV
ncbi:hypothetical protein KQX54_001838 [Cotesia glomerata]|uniref:Uncharacterized protein n=1 Tax=Cotesia glomerata TaxID=32391 RepID=A0AAV7J5I2_COTGL|nr:hypothetical protein KQX54_001838 [Cotesia glomerata]